MLVCVQFRLYHNKLWELSRIFKIYLISQCKTFDNNNSLNAKSKTITDKQPWKLHIKALWNGYFILLLKKLHNFLGCWYIWLLSKYCSKLESMHTKYCFNHNDLTRISHVLLQSWVPGLDHNISSRFILLQETFQECQKISKKPSYPHQSRIFALPRSRCSVWTLR